MVLSLAMGATSQFGPAAALEALFGRGSDATVSIVQGLRLPRMLMGAMVGANLAVAGALVQGVTRNPLVEPSIIGVNAGAALAVAVVGLVISPNLASPLGLNVFPMAAFVGAAISAILVYSLAGSEGSPVRLALAGVTVAILGQSIIVGVVIINSAAVQFVLHWTVGGIDGGTWRQVELLTPYFAVGMVASLAIARSVTIVSLGDDVARSLGERVELVRLEAFALLVLLAGAAVAVAGPIAMVGLMVPHICRALVGTDYRRLLPMSAVLGAVLLTLSDVASRFLAPPTETPVGVLTAILGTPFFIYLARRGGRA
jgi:ferric citrate transport system permease protein